MKEQGFEKTFERLEEILERMNSGELSLDDSLKLYEEADKLIRNCNKRLSSAEKRIETLIKNRERELQLDKEGNPETEDYDSEGAE